ncbi:hypothetical protein OROMI_016522 [Orobanche minor]
MALQKRLDYGFNGYQLPPTPRAARSVRRRCLFKRKADDQQMCAFDLLATVAGKLLSDGENCPPPAKEKSPIVVDNIVKKEKNGDKPLEEKACCERNFIFTELVSEVPNPNSCSNKHAYTQNDVSSRPASGVTTSDCSEKVGPAEQLVNDDCKLRLGIFTPVGAKLSGFRVSSNCGSEDDGRKYIKLDSESSRNLSISNKASMYSSGHLENSDRKSSALICSVNNNVKFPFSRNHTPCVSFPVIQDNVKLATRDDDENSSWCTEPSSRTKAIKAASCAGDGRFRKLPSSNQCKITSNMKDVGCCNAESCSYSTKKNGFKWQRSLRDYPFKKRKLYDCGSVNKSNSEDGTDGDGLGSGPMLPGVISTTTSVPGGYVSFNSRNAQVKLKIKSFRVPELLIEIPETATVGSLKRTVMEAVNAVLGGGLRVGVLLQGKKIRDDNKTLAQAGLSHDNKMDSLGFTLEPSSTRAPIRLYPEDHPDQMLCQSPQPLSRRDTRYPPTPRVTQSAGVQQKRNLDPSSNDGLRTSFSKFMESDYDSAHCSPGMSSLQRTTSESKALVPLSSTKQDALSVVPLRKSKRSESTAQRRIRRPFTVSEVEALVQAVEKLGTGRWRDVKLRAFDSAKHRTYVDLKDKWKTLVHTARISPQQRRGEPVPQELLDRVLTAHAYWSQQQAKQQLKSQPDTCLLL